MAGLIQPVGDLPPKVYWVRRIATLAILVIGVVVIGFLLFSPRGTDPNAPAPGNQSPAVSVSPSPSPSFDALAADRACTDADVTLTTSPKPFDVGAGTMPMFEVKVSMTGVTPCKLSLAAEDTELRIRSGSDQVYSTLQCPADGTFGSTEYLLQPGGADELVQVTWNRQRSVDGCAPQSTSPGAGFYMAKVTIQGIEAAEAQFRLQ